MERHATSVCGPLWEDRRVASLTFKDNGPVRLRATPEELTFLFFHLTRCYAELRVAEVQGKSTEICAQ